MARERPVLEMVKGAQDQCGGETVHQADKLCQLQCDITPPHRKGTQT